MAETLRSEETKSRQPPRAKQRPSVADAQPLAWRETARINCPSCSLHQGPPRPAKFQNSGMCFNALCKECTSARVHGGDDDLASVGPRDHRDRLARARKDEGHSDKHRPKQRTARNTVVHQWIRVRLGLWTQADWRLGSTY